MGAKKSVEERLRGHLNRGRKLWRAKDNEGAKRAFVTGRRAARRAKQEGDAKVFEGLIRLIEADPDGAVEHLNMALEASALTLRGTAHHYLGYAYDEKGDYDRAIECYQKALAEESFDTPGKAWFRMGYDYDEKGDYDRAIECYEKALAEKSYDTPGKAWNNMGFAYRKKGDYDRAIECYQKALAEESYDTPGKAWFNMGYDYDEKGDYDRAIECCEKALADEGYDTPGKAWHNMGFAYGNKGDYDRAIECYEKALREESYDTPGTAWNSMGTAYGGKGDHDRAIECYEKALAEETYDTPGDAWNNMGVAYVGKGDYERAIQCYEKALEESFDKPGIAWFNMGPAYEEIGKYARAVECYEKAVEAFRKAGEERRAGLAQMRLEMAKRRRDDRSRLADQALREVLETVPPYVAGLRAEVAVDRREELLLTWSREVSAFQQYAEKDPSGLDNVFAALKGWSSSIPFLPPDVTGEVEANPCKGGGYLIRWRGKGLVIDPGINFVDNFHREDFHITEIDAVVTTHEHVDHCFDLEQIHDLVYQYNRQILKASSDGEPLGQPHRVLYCLDPGTKAQRGRALAPRRKNVKAEPPLELRPSFFHGEEVARHIGMRIIPFDVSRSRAERPQGLIVECLDEDNKPVFRLGFTSDAEYNDDLVDRLIGCDVVVMHIGTTDDKDIAGERPPDHHLGCCGTTKLVKELDSPLFLIAEFWAGRGDLRLDLTKSIEHQVGAKKLILPLDIGFMMEIPSRKIRCSSCRDHRDARSLITVPPARPFGTLRYLCPRCVT